MYDIYIPYFRKEINPMLWFFNFHVHIYIYTKPYDLRVWPLYYEVSSSIDDD